MRRSERRRSGGASLGCENRWQTGGQGEREGRRGRTGFEMRRMGEGMDMRRFWIDSWCEIRWQERVGGLRGRDVGARPIPSHPAQPACFQNSGVWERMGESVGRQTGGVRAATAVATSPYPHPSLSEWGGLLSPL